MNKFGYFLLFLASIILCAAAISIINPFKKIADYNDKIRVKDLLKISQVLEKYHGDYGRYPSYDSKNYTINVNDEDIPWGATWEPYIAFLPKDPSRNQRYVYVSSSTDNYQSYRIYASLQDPAEQKNVCSLTGECPNVSGKNLCGVAAPCNYAVTSSNTSP